MIYKTHNDKNTSPYKDFESVTKYSFKKIQWHNLDLSFKMSYHLPKWTWTTLNLIWNLLQRKFRTLDITKKDFPPSYWEKQIQKVPFWYSNLVKWSSLDPNLKKMRKKSPEKQSATSPKPSASRQKLVTSRWPIS